MPPVSDDQLAEHYPAIAAAAALPQPSLSVCYEYIELSLGVTFCACLIFPPPLHAGRVLGGDSLSHWPVTHTLLLCVALPIALIYIAIALVTAIRMGAAYRRMSPLRTASSTCPPSPPPATLIQPLVSYLC